MQNYKGRQTNQQILKTFYLWYLEIIQTDKSINQKLKQSPNESINEIFGETKAVLSLKQTPNFLRLLSLNRKNTRLPSGLFNCNNKNCKLYV